MQLPVILLWCIIAASAAPQGLIPFSEQLPASQQRADFQQETMTLVERGDEGETALEQPSSDRQNEASSQAAQSSLKERKFFEVSKAIKEAVDIHASLNDVPASEASPAKDEKGSASESKDETVKNVEKKSATTNNEEGTVQVSDSDIADSNNKESSNGQPLEEALFVATAIRDSNVQKKEQVPQEQHPLLDFDKIIEEINTVKTQNEPKVKEGQKVEENQEEIVSKLTQETPSKATPVLAEPDVEKETEVVPILEETQTASQVEKEEADTVQEPVTDVHKESSQSEVVTEELKETATVTEATVDESPITETLIQEDKPQEIATTEKTESEVSVQEETHTKAPVGPELPTISENAVGGQKSPLGHTPTEDLSTPTSQITPEEESSTSVPLAAEITTQSQDETTPSVVVAEETTQVVIDPANDINDIVESLTLIFDDATTNVADTAPSPVKSEVEKLIVTDAPPVEKVTEKAVKVTEKVLELTKEVATTPPISEVISEGESKRPAEKVTIQEIVEVKSIPLKDVNNAIFKKGNPIKPKKPDQKIVSRSSIGKSLTSNSIDSRNQIDTSAVAQHFGFTNPSQVKMMSHKSFMYEGVPTDPKTLVAPQYRNFIYYNDSPDVITAKIAFFRIHEAITPSRL